MKIRITIDMEVSEMPIGESDASAITYLKDMSADELHTCIENGLSLLFGDNAHTNELMFDGEDHLLIVGNVHIVSVVDAPDGEAPDTLAQTQEHVATIHTQLNVFSEDTNRRLGVIESEIRDLKAQHTSE